jgi:ribonuclease PH
VEAAKPRIDGRRPDELRGVDLEPGFVRTADGSVLASFGETVVICTASVGSGVPSWREHSGKGWITAEYGMLPASTGERRPREAVRGRLDGRTVEIQRLIGRSLRAAVDFDRLGPRTVVVDCDVLQADGGTRCAAITGGYVALELALSKLVERGELSSSPLTTSVAAVSCGLVDGTAMLDLCYREDVSAEVDMNVVMTGEDEFVEVQATGERVSFARGMLDELLDLAAAGIQSLREDQAMAVRRAAGAGQP